MPQNQPSLGTAILATNCSISAAFPLFARLKEESVFPAGYRSQRYIGGGPFIGKKNGEQNARNVQTKQNGLGPHVSHICGRKSIDCLIFWS